MRVRDFGLVAALGVASAGSAAGQTVSPTTAPDGSRAAATAARVPAAAAPVQAQAPENKLRGPDVVYVPTPQNVVDAMLKLANVTASDVVYDLGSGDGRIPITAAERYGVRAVGIDIDPARIKEANANLAKSKAGDKVRFLNQDLFETDLSPATVITLYLLPTLNQKLIPKLKQLKPGTRIVSHSFDMGTEWAPEKTEDVQGRMIYLWTIK
jgi:SAM-dependent methyltransferase